MKLAYDLSILRHPPAGTAVYARELLRAMVNAGGGDRIIPTNGWPRVARGGLLRRGANLAVDVGWLTLGSAAVAARNHVDAWYSPANVLPTSIRRPMIVTIHDVNFLAIDGHYDRAFALYAERAFRGSARRAAAVLTISEFSRGQLIERLGVPADRITVAYPGIDHTLRVEPAPPDPALPDRYALFVGQTEPHKNISLLVDAWRTGRIPDGLHLIVAGPPGRDGERLSEVVTGSPARDLIHFVGWVDGPRLARLYENATCFLFPSLAEGFGLPPLEAMAHGIPTAVADRTSLPEVTADGALRFDPDDPIGLATLVERLCDDEVLRHRLTEEGRRVSERYRWGTTARIAWQVIKAAAS